MNKYSRILRKNVIVIPQGSDFSVSVPIPGVTDLAGCSVAAELITMDGVLRGVFDVSLPDPAVPTLALSMPPATTGTLTATRDIQHVWGVRVTTPDGTKLPEIQGGALVIAAVVSPANTGSVLVGTTLTVDGGTFGIDSKITFSGGTF